MVASLNPVEKPTLLLKYPYKLFPCHVLPLHNFNPIALPLTLSITLHFPEKPGPASHVRPCNNRPFNFFPRFFPSTLAIRQLETFESRMVGSFSPFR